MFSHSPSKQVEKAALYEELLAAALELVRDESDAIANMANLAALFWQCLPDLNWAGFYRARHDGLVLGPFQGKPACIRIPFGSGVCGAAAITLQTQVVPDVHAFPGHIACDSASASEMVVPVILDGRLLGVIDLDSPLPGRFDNRDASGMEAVASGIAASIDELVP